jgi:hypothetical protein
MSARGAVARARSIRLIGRASSQPRPPVGRARLSPVEVVLRVGGGWRAAAISSHAPNGLLDEDLYQDPR